GRGGLPRARGRGARRAGGRGGDRAGRRDQPHPGAPARARAPRGGMCRGGARRVSAPARGLDFTGKVALVTGGSRGVGRAVALLLAGHGADVGVTWHTRAADAEAVTRAVRGMGRKAFAAGGDLADPGVVERVFREFRACFGRLDLFVANAGVWPPEAVPLRDLPEDRWRR